MKAILTILSSIILAERSIAQDQYCPKSNTSDDIWYTIRKISGQGIINNDAGYSVKTGSYTKINNKNGKYSVSTRTGSGNTVTHCSSAVLAVFQKYIVDNVNSGKMSFTPKQMELIGKPGGPIFNIFYGNTPSIAYLNNMLGGLNIKGTFYKNGDQTQIKQALMSAKRGDFLKFGRVTKSGHQTIFKELRGDEVCYWSSNRATGGIGEQCEPIKRLNQVAISRLPDTATLEKNLKKVLDNYTSTPGSSTNRILASNARVDKLSMNNVQWHRPHNCKNANVAEKPTDRDIASDSSKQTSPSKKQQRRQEYFTRNQFQHIQLLYTPPQQDHRHDVSGGFKEGLIQTVFTKQGQL